MLKLIGRYLDKKWRRFRPYILPDYRRAYNTLISNAVKPPEYGKRVVFDFQTNVIDGPQGRRFYGLHTFLTRSGYHPIFVDHYLFLANPKDNFKTQCFKQPYSVLSDSGLKDLHTEGLVVVTDKQTDHHALAGSGAHLLKVNLNVGEALETHEFPWPFPMFPGVYRLNLDKELGKFRTEHRHWLFFFGGQSSSQKYNKSWVTEVYGKLSRTTFIEIARRELLSNNLAVEEPEDGNALTSLSETFVHGGVFVFNERFKIPLETWLSSMAKSRFFFACPGVRYPMSHNAVEAMAVGTVPIIEYPEAFFPALEHGINCLSFEGESGLRNTIKLAAELPESDWKKLSQNAIDYYEKYQDPAAVVASLINANRAEDVDTIRLMPFLKAGGGHI